MITPVARSEIAFASLGWLIDETDELGEYVLAVGDLIRWVLIFNLWCFSFTIFSEVEDWVTFEWNESEGLREVSEVDKEATRVTGVLYSETKCDSRFEVSIES